MDGADGGEFRQAMSRVGAAVHVVTTTDHAGRHGLTASAVCSVTDAPPTLLFCINRQTSSHGSFTVGGPVCINTLAAGQKDISAVFASRERLAERFAHGTWRTEASGAPVLDGAAAFFDGTISDIVDVGTHSVMFVRVATAGSTDGPVLLYMGRAYHQLPHINELLD
jgi:flavin reductase